MGNVSLGDVPAVLIYTRLGIMAGQLGIDASPFETTRKQLTPGLERYARVWLDAEFRRIALRTWVSRPPMLARPGTTYLELETNPGADVPSGTLFISGPRALEDDLELLGRGVTGADLSRLEGMHSLGSVARPVEAAVVGELRRNVTVLGNTVALLGQRMIPDELQWLVGIQLGSESVREVYTVAEAIGVAPYQAAMLGQLHGELATAGCMATLACTPSALRSELTIEYRDVAWPKLVEVTDRLRRIRSAAGWGVLAGAFGRERAAYVEVTFGSDQLARVRAAYEEGTQASSEVS